MTFIRVGPQLGVSIRSRLQANEPRLQIVELSDLSEEKLISIYQRADVLFFPSILEGFGFPTIKAMAAGTPVVASNAIAMPEMKDQQLADKLREKGRKQDPE